MSHQEPTDPGDPFQLGEDPGWRPRGDRPDALVALRSVFLAIVGGLVLIGVVAAFLAAGAERDGSEPSGVVVGGAVVVVGLLALLGVRFLPLRLDCSDELALAGSYRSRFFARTALSELPALAGFVGVILTGIPALYALGLAFAVVGLAVSGPTKANLVRDQERLALEGCAIALVPALRHPPRR